MRIDSYSFGKIKVDGREYNSDLVIFPERVKSNWWRKSGHFLGLEDTEDILEYKPEVLVIGTGAMGLMKVDSPVTDKLDSMGIEYTISRTPDAVGEYNGFYKERRTVFAAHLTC